jgi:hypothetical protein
MIALAPLGGVLVAVILWDAFETMVLPRRVNRSFRLARFFYRTSWSVWRAVGTRLKTPAQCETVLAIFGPLSIIGLFALWAGALIFGFALLIYAHHSDLLIDGRVPNFGTTIYMSGTTFFTLGIGDVAPSTGWGRAVTVVEAGTGFGFLALVIGYLPVLYQGFSRRETSISLLDARAGSPPCAGELLRRIGVRAHDPDGEAEGLLAEWERWSADLLESQLSYPVLAYFRSQHDRQSWLAALTAILDFSAMLLACAENRRIRRQAELTFAMARHAAVDLTQVFGRELADPNPVRFSAADADRLVTLTAGISLTDPIDQPALERLRALRATYEPYVFPLSQFLVTPLPPWFPEGAPIDDWRTSDRETVLG